MLSRNNFTWTRGDNKNKRRDSSLLQRRVDFHSSNVIPLCPVKAAKGEEEGKKGPRPPPAKRQLRWLYLKKASARIQSSCYSSLLL